MRSPAESPAAVSRRSMLAVTLSGLWPGMGEAAAGRVRLAFAALVPYTAAVVLLATWVAGDPTGAVLRLLDPSLTFVIATLIAMGFVWRAGSVLLASRLTAATRAPAGMAAVAALVIALLVPHAIAINYVATFGAAGAQIFNPEPGALGAVALDSDQSPEPSGLVQATLDPGDPEPRIVPGGPVIDGATGSSHASSKRVTVLFVGVDAAPGRAHALTDSIIVATFDPETNSGATISIPRDVAGFPLRSGGRYLGKINSLASYAAGHRDRFPRGGMQTLADEVSYLVGIPVNYYVVVNLPAFQLAVDAVGGVDVENQSPIVDLSYRWLDGHYGLSLPAGRLHLDGESALAFVRSRKGAGDNDYTRARRQQQVLLALRARLLDPAVFPRIPAVLDALEGLVRTNWSPDDLAQALALAAQSNDATIRSVVLGPPYATHPPVDTTGGAWILRLDLARVAAVSVKLFGSESRYHE